MLLCGYSPFRSDDMKELVRQTTEAKIMFHDRYWNNVSEEGKRSLRATCIAKYRLTPGTLSHALPRHTAKAFIRALLDPDPARRLTAEQALAHTWLTTAAPSTEHDLSGLRENFDPRARWRNAIGAARAITRMGLVQKSRSRPPSISDDDDDDEVVVERPTHLGVPAPSESRSAVTPSSSSSSPPHLTSPSPPAQGPAKAAEAPAPPKTAAPVRATSSSHLAAEPVEVEVERRMPGSFNYERAGDAVSPIDVVGILGGFWRRFNLSP